MSVDLIMLTIYMERFLDFMIVSMEKSMDGTTPLTSGRPSVSRRGLQ
jgi:hypothetical protein